MPCNFNEPHRRALHKVGKIVAAPMPGFVFTNHGVVGIRCASYVLGIQKCPIGLARLSNLTLRSTRIWLISTANAYQHSPVYNMPFAPKTSTPHSTGNPMRIKADMQVPRPLPAHCFCTRRTIPKVKAPIISFEDVACRFQRMILPTRNAIDVDSKCLETASS